MKHYFFYLIATLVCLTVLAFIAFQERGRIIRLNRHSRARRLNSIERLALPFVVTMSALATRVHHWFSGGNRLALGNAILTYPACGDTLLADEAIGRFKLIKHGTDIYHAGLCDKNDIPIGFTRDASAAAAEDRFAFDYLGLAHKGTEATASGACTAGNLCCPGDNGTIRDITQVAGETVYVCGILRTSAANGEQVVFVPHGPSKLVIA